MKIKFVSGIMDEMNDKGERPDLAPGSSEWRLLGDKEWRIFFICPCGCHKIRSVPVIGDRKWNWDGNKELPTLTPSIQVIGECGWHGYLTKGEFRTC